MTSHSGVMIVCSIFLMGKPLCMHTQNCQCSSANAPASTSESLITTKAPKPHRLFSNPFSMPVTYISHDAFGGW